jgi:predicted ATPase
MTNTRYAEQGFMGNHIKSTNVNIIGLLVASIEFRPGLNIISGENGTMKTRLLQTMRGGTFTQAQQQDPIRIQAISPKRNSERRTVETIIQSIRTQNRKLGDFITERQINDQGFDNYPSIGDLFYALYEDRCKDGGNQKVKMAEVVDDLNDVIRGVFDHYSLTAEWSETTGSPNLKVKKHHATTFPIESLSLGEQEVLSLITNLYASKDRYEVYLIDEPEVHLNWHLEERLFEFFLRFCERYDKQMIVATHSRAIFKPDILDRAQFLSWDEQGKIVIGKELRERSKNKAGRGSDQYHKNGAVYKAHIFC